MALENVLANIPGLAGYLAMEQNRQGQANQAMQNMSGLLGLALRQQQEQRLGQMQNEQLAEMRRKAADEQALSAALPDLAQRYLGGEQPNYAGFGHALVGLRGGLQPGLSLINASENRDARIASQNAILEQRREAATQLHETRLAQAKTQEERAAETARHNRFMEGIQGQMAVISAERLRHSKEADEFSDVKRQVSAVMMKILNNQPISQQERAFLDTWQRMNPITAFTRDALGGSTPPVPQPQPSNRASGAITRAPERPSGVPNNATWSAQHNSWVVRRDGKLMRWVPD